MRKIFAFLIVLFMLVGCGAPRQLTHRSESEAKIDLSKGNYSYVVADATGSSMGVKLLGIIPIIQPSYINAMSNLYKKAGIQKGKAYGVLNIYQEESSIYLIIISLPKVRVRADIIEFTKPKE